VLVVAYLVLRATGRTKHAQDAELEDSTLPKVREQA
jgi:hypothetical protein